MSEEDKIEVMQLNDRLKSVILGTCNTIGCKDCDLKWDGGYQATELQGKIDDIEYAEFK